MRPVRKYIIGLTGSIMTYNMFVCLIGIIYKYDNGFSLARSQLKMLSVYSIQSFQEYYKMINIST